MTKEEIIALIKDKLKIRIDLDHTELVVKLIFDNDTISEDAIYLDVES